jgi:hypothetical protein
MSLTDNNIWLAVLGMRYRKAMAVEMTVPGKMFR